MLFGKETDFEVGAGVSLCCWVSTGKSLNPSSVSFYMKQHSCDFPGGINDLHI